MFVSKVGVVPSPQLIVILYPVLIPGSLNVATIPLKRIPSVAVIAAGVILTSESVTTNGAPERIVSGVVVSIL